MDVTKQFSIGKRLILGLRHPVNQEMYDAICSFANAVWGQGGYGCIYEAVIIETVTGQSAKMYRLENPVAVYRKIVDMLK